MAAALSAADDQPAAGAAAAGDKPAVGAAAAGDKPAGGAPAGGDKPAAGLSVPGGKPAGGAPAGNDQPAATEIKTLVEGRAVCSPKCREMLDLANGLKKCPGCDRICNVAHHWCTGCAMRLGVCEVCGKPMRAKAEAGQAEPTEADLKSLVAGNSAFAWDLYGRLKDASPKADERGNLSFSPYGLTTALAMAWAGARGETEKQMAAVLHFGLDQQRLHPALRKLTAGMNEAVTKQGSELHMACALWGQMGMDLKRDFLELTSAMYGAGLREVDFAASPETACRMINAWVAGRTRDRIKDLVQRSFVDEGTRLMLTSVIYFRGFWQSPFSREGTRSAPFTLAGGGTVEVPMMHQQDSLRYMEGEGFRALELPFRDRDVRMVILLPDSADGMARFEAGLSSARVDDWLARLSPAEVEVGLPKFSISSALTLAPTLSAMGMTDAFAPAAADFSGIASGPLFVQTVVHRAIVEVNEEGTIAAAATAVGLAPADGDSLPRRVFRADHPFVIVIRDNRSGSILFLGRVMNPRG